MPVPVLLKAAFGASLALTVSEAVPTFDVSASCRAVAKVNAAIGLAVSQSADACIRDEEQARAELVQKWNSYPAGARARCIAENMISDPSYVDVLVCLQLTQEADALKTPLLGASKTKRKAQ